MTSRRPDWAARRRGDLNRDRGSRRLFAGNHCSTAPDRRATGWCLDQRGPARSERSPLCVPDATPRLGGRRCRISNVSRAKTRLYSGESEADPIGHLCRVCGSLLEVGELGEIVGYGVIETCGRTWHSGASGAGQLIADRVGAIIAQRELKHARVRLEIERCDADSVSPQAPPLALALLHGRRRSETPPPGSHHSRAAATAARPPSFRRRAPSSLTVPPEEVRFALGGKLGTDMSLVQRRG